MVVGNTELSIAKWPDKTMVHTHSGVFKNMKGGRWGTFQVYIFKCSSFGINFFHIK